MRDISQSPVPGMNPYLESPANWSDFHSTFIHAIREDLSRKLPEPYFARLDVLAVMLAPDLERPKYHWPLNHPLPIPPIPLRQPDPDISLNLQDPFKVAFSRGQYGRFIDYSQLPPPPALLPSDAVWLTQVIEKSAT